MNIDKISLCQNETWDYSRMPRALSSDHEPLYAVAYPFSKELALDCERIVFQLREHAVCSELCFHLVIVFVDAAEPESCELMDLIAFRQNKMRFVNIGLPAAAFNSMDQQGQRQLLLKFIGEAVTMVAAADKARCVQEICEAVYHLGEATECLLLEKHTKQYDLYVRFVSSLHDYTAKLYIINNKTSDHRSIVILEHVTFADLIHKLHRIVIKNKQCIIQPTNKYEYDEPIVVALEG